MLVACTFAAFVASVVALIVGDYRLVTSLRSNHPRVWEGLGRPSPWFSRLEDVSSVHRFLHERAYASLEDAALIRTCDRLRMLTFLACALGAAALAVATMSRRFA